MIFGSKKIVTFHLSGGLGNQLFQLAYMLWQTKCNDIVPVVHFGRQHKNFNNPGGIELLNLEMRVKNYNNLFAKMIGRAHYYLIRNSAFHRRIWKVHLSQVVGYSEHDETLNGSNVVGYFQTYVFVDRVASTLRSQFQLASHSLWAKKLIQSALELQPIAVHIRRSDYQNHTNSIGILSLDYYKSALHSLGSVSQNSPIWIFSDDLELAYEFKNEYIPLLNSTVIICPEFESAIGVLKVMSACSHFVLANSTFSWWAAYLSHSKTVVAPKIWFKGMQDPKKLIPATWLLHDSHWIEK
jgi:hypothetical protein